MPRSPHEPLYRIVLRDAFVVAWQEKRLWPLALVAGFLLSGSIYDVIWKLLNALAPNASIGGIVGVFWSRAVPVWSGFSISDLIFGGITVFQITALFLIIGGALAGFSIVCQSALVFALGTRRGNARPPSIKEALTIGARALWPVAALNILVIAILWSTRALLAIVLSVGGTTGTVGAYLFSLLAFIAFVAVAVAAVIIQIFALNAMILQGATLIQGLERGLELLTRHWIVAVETAVILFFISVGSWILTVAANMVLAVPLFMLLIIATILGSQLLLTTTLYLGIMGFVAVMIAVSAYLVALQYATWTLLYRRLGEGGVFPKIHRWVRQFTHGYRVPGA